MARRRNNEEVAFNITPMIDMTFLLLVFFMVTTRITEQETAAPITLPIAKTALERNNDIERDIINLDGQGNYYVGSVMVTEAELKAHLNEKFKDYPPLQIYLRADKNTPAKKIREFMDMAGAAGALDVIFGSFTQEAN